MKTKDIALTANRNLLRSKLRTSLTIIAIFVGAFTLSITSALGAGVTSYIDSQLGNLGQEDTLIVTPKTDDAAPGEPQAYDPDKATVRGGNGESQRVLTQADIDKIAKLPEVEKITPFTPVLPDFIVGPNGEKFTLAFSPLDEETGVDLSAGELMKVGTETNELILPDGYVKALGFSSAEEAIGATVELTVRDAKDKAHTVKATVKGIMAQGLLGASGAVANQSLRDELYSLQSDGLPEAAKNIYQAATVKLVDSEDATIKSAKDAVKEMGLEGFTIEDQLGLIKTVITAITTVLNGFALLALLAAGFGIVNTLLMSVQERTREIGLMKAMGMSSKRVFALFSIEAALIGFWGSLLAFGAAAGIGTIANGALSDTLFKDLPDLQLFQFTLGNAIFVIALITGIALLSGTLPARRAAKLSPIDALRYE